MQIDFKLRGAYMKQMTPFDYSSLSSDDAREFRAAAERIKICLKRTAEDIVEIGNELLAVMVRAC